MDQNSEIDAWRRVHRQLTLAIMQSQDNIAAELTKRRYLLEEMNRCRVLNAQKSASGGSSGSAKVKKKATPKKVALKKAPAPASKVPKKAPSPSVTSTAAKKAPAPKAAAARNTASGDQAKSAAAVSAATRVGNASSEPGNEVGVDALQPYPQLAAGISPQQMSQVYFQPAVAGMYGSNMNMGIGATPQSMDLAFQLIQQMNQNATNDGGDDDDADENDADD